MYAVKEKIYPVYVSKHNLHREGWHYITVKKLPALLREIPLNSTVIFLVWIVFILLQQKTKVTLIKKVCGNKDFCNIVMPSKDTIIVEFNQYEKSDKASLIIYTYLECLIGKNDGCKNNPEISSTTKVSEHISSGFSMFAISSFKSIEYKHDVYRGKGCMEKFCDL